MRIIHEDPGELTRCFAYLNGERLKVFRSLPHLTRVVIKRVGLLEKRGTRWKAHFPKRRAKKDKYSTLQLPNLARSSFEGIDIDKIMKASQ